MKAASYVRRHLSHRELTHAIAKKSYAALGYGHQDDTSRVPATAPPSRPPSRINMHDNTQPGTEPSSTTATPGNTGEDWSFIIVHGYAH